MKVGVLSRHSVANYGSLLQAYALQTSIEKMGYDVVNINYTPSNEEGEKLAKTMVSVSRWGNRQLTKWIYMLYQYPSTKITYNRFKKYRKKYLKETKEYTEPEQLAVDLPQVDLFCTGSDQVWNLLYDNKLDDTYFMSFLPNNKSRIAYAASFGGNEFKNTNIQKYKRFLEKYKHITVREKSGLEILSRFGIAGEQVLDPTLLLSKEEWNLLIPKKIVKEEYILIYQLRPNKEFDNYAKKVSKITGLKLVRISTMYFQKFKSGKFCYLPKVDEFLWYISNAKIVLTDSFHGTCFAITFNTPFIEVLPGRFNARNESLLETLKVSDRILRDYNDFSLLAKKIDWDKVNNNLYEERKKSIGILKNMLKGEYNEN